MEPNHQQSNFQDPNNPGAQGQNYQSSPNPPYSGPNGSIPYSGPNGSIPYPGPNGSIPYPPQNQPAPDRRKENLSLASLIIGIVAMILSIPFSIFVCPLAIVGFVLGLLGASGGKKVGGLVLNVIAFLIPIAILAFVISIIALVLGFSNLTLENIQYYLETGELPEGVVIEDGSATTKKNPVEGEYECTPGAGTSSSSTERDYTNSLYLYNDMTFQYGQYGDLENNSVSGTYTYEDEHKTNGSGDYKYYMVDLDGEIGKFITDGEVSEEDYNAQFEFAITSSNGKREGAILFTSSYNMYYCYEQ